MNKIGFRVRRFVMNLKRPSKAKNLRLLEKRGETLGSFIIRDATVADIPALATLHAKTWSQTYWTALHPPTAGLREYQWRQQFEKVDDTWFCLLVENKKGQLVGFARGVKYSHSDLPDFSGELNKIYLLREYQRIGLGRRLLCHVARKFLDLGISNMVLFGVAENPSGRFHEIMGGEKLCGANGEFHGGYCWRDFNKLISICGGD